MAIKYKIDILAAMKEHGYSSYKIRKEKIFGESVLQKMRNGAPLSWAELNTVCAILGCQPGDLIEYVPDEKPE